MQVYKKILVTIDCSPVDDTILKHVSLLALQNKAKIYLLHVVHSHTLDQDRAMREKAEATLTSYRASLQEQGVDVTVLIRGGEPEKEILKEIEENDYDLVAMATHGHTFFGDFLYGSVSDILKHKINVPLLLIKSDR
ncbi:MAG: universal stress protein [Calditrichaeota bacterium]|nr:universal stress protein [Calditrichota bacterium]